MLAVSKSVITWLVVMGLLAAVMITLAPSTPVLGADCPETTSIQDGVKCVGDNIENDTDLTTVVQSVINTLLFLIGIISVIMLIVGGIRFVVSSGNQSQVEGARNTILYAIVGLVVAFVAWGIVNFVIGALTDNT